jgi:hypothetical protein
VKSKIIKFIEAEKRMVVDWERELRRLGRC